MKYDFHSMLPAHYAKGLVIGLIVLCIALLFFEYFNLFFNGIIPKVVIKNEVVVDKEKQDKPTALLNASLFGVYVPEDLNEDNVKKSMLNLELMGVLLDSNVAQSQVILRAANGDEKTYKTGDSIPGGAVIKKIMASGVLVERNGTLERLSLPKKELNFEPLAKPLKEDES